ncbi:MAG TPA: response regulator transcription factor, partial [Nitrospira sp.]|nr:response regulator transcription factor [Nitrospira sp.]
AMQSIMTSHKGSRHMKSGPKKWDSGAGEKPENRVTLFIADRQELFRTGLRAMMGRYRDLLSVGEAGSIEEMLHRLPGLRPHVLLLDADLCEGAAHRCYEKIAEASRTTQVLVLTRSADLARLSEVFDPRVGGYILREAMQEQLVRAIGTVCSGGWYLDPELVEPILAAIRRYGGSFPSPPPETLSGQERRITSYLADGYTNKEIAKAMALAEKTIKNYVAIIFGKLGVSRRAQVAARCSRSTGGGVSAPDAGIAGDFLKPS